jgi:hypothetical protein
MKTYLDGRESLMRNSTTFAVPKCMAPSHGKTKLQGASKAFAYLISTPAKNEPCG